VLQIGRQPEQLGPNIVQMILLLVGNVAIIGVAGLLLGRAARRYAAQHGWATA